MKFLSTKQIAELWGISPRRVAMLANQGRIEGSRQIDGRWFIPEEAEKPGDPRKAGNPVSAPKEDEYIYPFLLAVIHSEEQIQKFSPMEAELYCLCTVYETGDFQQARTLAESLLTSENPYVRLGALYHLPMICMYLSDFQATDKYTVLFRTMLLDKKEHTAELEILLRTFDAEMKNISEFTIAADSYQIDLYPEELLPYVAIHKLLADLGKFAYHNAEIDFTEHELFCRMTELQGYYFCTMLFHLYLSLYDSVTRNEEHALQHLETAIAIGISHGTLLTIAFYLTYNPEAATEILKKYPPQITLRIKELSDTVIRCRNAYAAYQGKSSTLSQLTADEYRIISLCLKKYSVKDMAASFGLTESGIKKRLAVLYKKLGVKSKQETLNVFLHSVMYWGID